MAGRARAGTGGGSGSRTGGGGTAARQAGTRDDSEVLIEFHRVGNAVKVTAVDPASLTEVSLVGDPAMGEATLARAAVRKLRYVLERRSRGGQSTPKKLPGGRSGSGSTGDDRGGTLV